MRARTILLVEDDCDSREVYSSVLRYAGFSVLEATHGREGIELARVRRPDVIVMDLALPQVDGWQATETLKSDPATAAIPVIAITVHAQDFYRGRAQAAGCDSFLAKPCSPTRLLGEITRVLDEQG